MFLCFVWLKVWSSEIFIGARARHEYFQLIPPAPHVLWEKCRNGFFCSLLAGYEEHNCQFWFPTHAHRAMSWLPGSVQEHCLEVDHIVCTYNCTIPAPLDPGLKASQLPTTSGVCPNLPFLFLFPLGYLFLSLLGLPMQPAAKKEAVIGPGSLIDLRTVIYKLCIVSSFSISLPE